MSLTLLSCRGDEKPVRRKLPFVEALIQMCTLLSEHPSEFSPLFFLLNLFPPSSIHNLLLSGVEKLLIPRDFFLFPFKLVWILFV